MPLIVNFINLYEKNVYELNVYNVLKPRFFMFSTKCTLSYGLITKTIISEKSSIVL